jgi:hypothetical protein
LKNQKNNFIRHKIVSKNYITLWDAVKTAENLNLAKSCKIPENLIITDFEVPHKCIPKLLLVFKGKG